MRKLAVSFIVILGEMAFLSACANSAVTPTQIESNSPTSTQPDVSMPVLVSWRIGDQPVVSRGNFTFAVHMVLVDGDRIVIVYTASGPTVDQSLVAKSVQLTDETGNLSYVPCPLAFPAATRTPAAYLALTAPPQPLPTQTVPPYPVATQPPPPPCTPSAARSVVTPMGQVGQIQLGAVTFAPRLRGVRELHLRINIADGAQPLDVFAAKMFAYPGNVADATGAVYRDGYLDQAGDRVSFNGFELAKGDQTAQNIQASRATGVPMTEKPRALSETQAAAAASWTPAPPRPTSTIVAIDPAALALSGGKPIELQATIRIEDLQSHQAQYLFMVVLTDGEVNGTLVQ